MGVKSWLKTIGKGARRVGSETYEHAPEAARIAALLGVPHASTLSEAIERIKADPSDPKNEGIIPAIVAAVEAQDARIALTERRLAALEQRL